MNQCKMGYAMEDNYEIPSRCNFQDNYNYASCKYCPHYNYEYDLIDKAIESAKCRIYRLKQNEGSTFEHQKKAENQQELMKITIKALEYYRDQN